METVFLKVVSLGLSASFLIVAVLLFRLLFRRAPRSLTLLLWAVVAVRLVCPVSVESDFSLLPRTSTMYNGFSSVWDAVFDGKIHGDFDGNAAEQATTEQADARDFRTSDADGDGKMGSGLLQEDLQGDASTDGVSLDLSASVSGDGISNNGNTAFHFDFSGNLTPIFAVVWLVGIATILLFAGISYARLRKKVAESAPARTLLSDGDLRAMGNASENIYFCDNIDTPFIFGIIRPKIYLPSSLIPKVTDADLSYILAHENAHLRRKDHILKAFGFLLLAVYWFNPLVWLSYACFCKDLELSCDEKVIANLTRAERALYANILLSCGMSRKFVLSYPLAFGEIGVKERVKAVLNFKKPPFWIVLAVFVVVAALAVGFLTEPRANADGVTTVFFAGKLGRANDVNDADENGANSATENDDSGENDNNDSNLNENDNITTNKNSTENTRNNDEFYETFRQAYYKKTLETYDFHNANNAKSAPITDETSDGGDFSYSVIVPFTKDGTKYRVQANYDVRDDKLWDVYITRTTTRESVHLYTNLVKNNADGKDNLYETYSPEDYYLNDLDTFIKTTYNLTDHISVNLPEPYTLGAYRGDLGWNGGSLIYPQYYKVLGDEQLAPNDWLYAGFLGKIDADFTGVTFNDYAIPDMSGIPLNHHSDVAYRKTISLDKADGWTAIVTHETHDLYTAAQQKTLEEQGEDFAKLDSTSGYHGFYFVKKGEKTYYYLTLSDKIFTEEQAETIARTVAISKE